MKNGKQWPIGITAAILAVVVACGVTIFIVAKHAPVEESNLYMQGYHDTDANYNDIIKAKNSFDKLYTISFGTAQISEQSTILDYSVKTLEGEIVDNAKFKVVLTLPYTSKEDILVENAKFNGSSYTFGAVDLPHPGRWNIMAKVSVGNEYRFYNLHADTRQPNTFEY